MHLKQYHGVVKILPWIVTASHDPAPTDPAEDPRSIATSRT